MAANTISVTFPGGQGHSLAAKLDLPDGAPKAYAIFAHCFTCGKDVKASTFISRALVQQGIAVLRFDFTGLGGSGGNFADTNFSTNVGDLVAAADFLREKYAAPQLLVGHSLGGAAVLAAAPGVPEAVAVATVNAPYEPAHVLHQFAHASDKIVAEGEAEVQLAGRAFRIQKQFIDDVAGKSLDDIIAKLGKALLVFHAPRDTTVGVDNAGQIFTRAKHPKSFVSLDDADHLLSRKEDAQYVGNVLASWVQRYLNTTHAPIVVDETLPAGTVSVAETGTGNFAEEIRVGHHVLRADEPVSIPGGTDTGPAPYDFLLSALGACTAMTVRMYANLKKLPLQKVSVRLRHEKIHAQDCADCETREGKVDFIEREITLEGDLDAAQRAKLMEIADKCPVHRTLHGEVKVSSKLV